MEMGARMGGRLRDDEESFLDWEGQPSLFDDDELEDDVDDEPDEDDLDE
jgi:hypothetical protein